MRPPLPWIPELIVPPAALETEKFIDCLIDIIKKYNTFLEFSEILFFFELNVFSSKSNL